MLSLTSQTQQEFEKDLLKNASSQCFSLPPVSLNIKEKEEENMDNTPMEAALIEVHSSDKMNKYLEKNDY